MRVFSPNQQTLVCANCSRSYVVYSLSEEYKSTLPYPCPRGDYQKSFSECPRCFVGEYWEMLAQATEDVKAKLKILSEGSQKIYF